MAIGLALVAAGAPPAALAGGCLSQGEARAAAQSGQILPMSRVIRKIEKAGGGQILPPPQLCIVGGQYVYVVNVLTGNGQVTRLSVDATTGAILGYWVRFDIRYRSHQVQSECRNQKDH